MFSQLSGQQKHQLHVILLSVFPKQHELEIMVSKRLNQSLEVIAGGRNLSQVAFELIKWADSHGKVEDLILGMLDAAPGSIMIQPLAKEMGIFQHTILSLREIFSNLITARSRDELDDVLDQIEVYLKYDPDNLEAKKLKRAIIRSIEALSSVERLRPYKEYPYLRYTFGCLWMLLILVLVIVGIRSCSQKEETGLLSTENRFKTLSLPNKDWQQISGIPAWIELPEGFTNARGFQITKTIPAPHPYTKFKLQLKRPRMTKREVYIVAANMLEPEHAEKISEVVLPNETLDHPNPEMIQREWECSWSLPQRNAFRINVIVYLATNSKDETANPSDIEVSYHFQ